MRRGLSIFLALFFGLGPLTATLQASDDSRLPACCRRNGAHHCAMSNAMMARMIQAAYGSTPILTPPSHCPLYPHGPATSIARVHALTPPAASLPALFEQPHSPVTSRADARVSQLRTRAGRGPPASNLA